MASASKVKAMQRHLLARTDLLNRLAMMNLLLAAATNVGQDFARRGAAPLLREARRRFEPRPGEAPDATGCASDDSYGLSSPDSSSKDCPRYDGLRCCVGNNDRWGADYETTDEDKDGSGSDGGGGGGGSGRALNDLIGMLLEAQAKRKRR